MLFPKSRFRYSSCKLVGMFTLTLFLVFNRILYCASCSLQVAKQFDISMGAAPISGDFKVFGRLQFSQRGSFYVVLALCCTNGRQGFGGSLQMRKILVYRTGLH